MQRWTLTRHATFSLTAVALLAALHPAWAQPPSCAGTGPSAEIVKSLIDQSREEIKAFNKAGGKPKDSSHPAVRWSATLWNCREAHPGTPAANDATAEAVHILIHAARATQALELADSVPPDDPAWKNLLNFVLEAATETNDFPACIRRVERLLPQWHDREMRARAQLALAGAYRRLAQTDQAAALYETVQREAAGTPFAEQAAGALRQLRELNPGQSAPAFAAKARDGAVVSLAGYRGRAVVLIFWSTT